MPFFLTIVLGQATRSRDAGGRHTLWEWIESNGVIIYPLVAIIIIGLIAATLIASFKSDDMNAEQKGALKMKIMQIMRRRISGVSADTVAAELQIDLLVAARLLAELDAEGSVAASGASGSARVQYRIRASHEAGRR